MGILIVNAEIDSLIFTMGPFMKPYITLQPSEQVLVNAASVIYAAYITTGRVEDGQEAVWMERSIKAAIRIARTTDEAVQADKEVD